MMTCGVVDLEKLITRHRSVVSGQRSAHDGMCRSTDVRMSMMCTDIVNAYAIGI